ncbi:BTAD domain-containing putative transcriptional regulator [Micromonospora sp. LOL_024]|uniref:BTAD domain-containing putative transcriptional regulator n=1 Tax=Micromonospora sp. LOL_024 TaxID=3345412 RepID=UPI003A88FBA8
MKQQVSTAVVAVVVLAAAPLVLLYLAGWPTPTMPSQSQLRAWIHQPLTTGFLTTLLQTSAWLLWAMLATATARHIHRAVAARLRWRIALRMPRPMQGLTAALLGATAVTSTALPAAAQTTTTTDTSPDSAPRENSLASVNSGHTHGGNGSGQNKAARHDPVASANGSTSRTVLSTTRPAEKPRDNAVAGAAHTCVVRDGDSLSLIAKRWLGDPDRWPEIWALNRGTLFDTVGGTFTNPDLIHPGWTLDLPADATPPGAAHPIPTMPSKPDTPRLQEPPVPVEPTSAPSTGEDSETPPSPTTAPSAAATSAPSTTGGTPSGHATRTPAPANNSSAESCGPGGITLGTGSWLDLGLAAAIAAAASLVWAWRRHRYRPRPPGPHSRSGDPDLTPLPAIVTHIRHALRRPTKDNTDDLDILDLAESTEAAPGHDRPAIDDDTAEQTHVASPDLADQPEPYAKPVPVVPTQDHPLYEVWPPAGLGLTGPGADAAGRGFLTAALAGRVDAPDTGGRVVIPAATVAALMGTAAVLPETPRLTVADDLADALDILETQTLHRSHLVYQHEVDTLADLRHTALHEEQPPPIIFISHASARHERARIAALLAQGRRLDIHGVLLGAWPAGDTIVVDTDGTTRRPDRETRHGAHPAVVGRLAVLTPTETIDLITTLAEAHTGEPPTTTPARPTTTTTTQGLPPRPEAIPDADNPAPHGTDAPMPADGEAPPREVPAADIAPPVTTDSRPEDGPGNDGPQPQERVAVRVLGGARIVDMDTTVPLRAKSLELLVYLVVHDGDATADAILDDLLPDAPRSKAPHRLHTYVSALRKTLARTGGPASYLTHPGRRYTLNREALDVDLWRMRAALRDAEQATDATTRLTALRAAVAAYRGGLAEGFDYEWIEVHRESIRRQALDAHLALANATGDPAEALTVLEAAIRHAPYTEAVYQQAMRAHAALGHHDEIHELRHTLTRRLEEIDATPSRDTIDLAHRLTASPRRLAAAPHDGRGRR